MLAKENVEELGLSRPKIERVGDKLCIHQAASVGIYRETDGPHVAYHLQITERIVVRLLYFICNLLNRFGFTRASKYLDNLSLQFCGIILDIHCRKNFGCSWSEKRASLVTERNAQKLK
jgi:hypothetical protein